MQLRRRDHFLFQERPERHELLLDQEEVLEKLDTKMDQAFNSVLEMSLKEKVNMRDAAYMVAIDRVVKAMQLRGWI